MTGQRVIFITEALLTNILKTGILPAVKVEGLPPDARLVRIIPDYSMNYLVTEPRIGCVYESEEWEPLPEGATIPVLTVKFTKLGGDDAQ